MFCRSFVVAAFLLVSLTLIAAEPHHSLVVKLHALKGDKGHCAHGEEYSKCGGCDPSCDNRKPVCTADCKKGCFCKKGLVRDSKQECVHPSKCPKCPKGEEYSKCGGCDPCCENRNPICTKECRIGCFCEKGLVRNSKDECVSPSKCPKCPKGEEYTKCSGCDPTCHNRKPVCDKKHCKKGCACEKGLVRNSKDECVSPSKCPKCPKGEEYTKCSGCDPSCHNRKPVCKKDCKEGCACEKGLVRNSKKQCVPPSKCHKLKCSKPKHKH